MANQAAWQLGNNIGAEDVARHQKTREDFQNNLRAFHASQLQKVIDAPLPDPQADPEGFKKASEQREWAQNQMEKVYTPEHHAGFMDSVHGIIFGPPKTPEQSQPSQAGDVPPSTPQAQHPFQDVPADHPLHKGNHLLGTLSEHLKAAAHPLPPKAPTDWGRIAEAQGQGEATQRALASQEEKRKHDYAMELAKEKGSTSRPVHIGDTTPQNAIANMKNLGYEYADERGEPITEAQLLEAPPGTKLVEFRQGGQTFAKLVDQNERKVSIGGIDYAMAPLGAQGPETLKPLGETTSTLPKEHDVPGMNPGETLHLGTRTVSRPGLTATAAKTAPAPATEETPTPELKTRPNVSSQAPTVPSPMAGPNARLNAKKSLSKQVPMENGVMPPAPQPFAPGTFMSQGKTTKPVVAKANAVAANIFGGNGEKPIWDAAEMYDNPELGKALNTALTLNALTIPGTEDDPGYMKTLETAVGITKWSQQQIRDANVRARKEVERLGGREALNMFARLAGMQEDLTALRAVTGSSAAQGSIKTMVRAAPVYNVSSAQDFRNQLAVTLNTAAAGLSAYPEINPQYVDWWKQGARLARGSTPKAKDAPEVPGQTKGAWSLAAAMALPVNKGKSAEQVQADLKKHGYDVTKP